jgi:protein TonB
MEKYLHRIYIVNVYPMNAKNITKSDFLDILFDGRNKDYGAYDLRRNEDRRVRNAIVGTASIALVIIGGYVLSNNLMAAEMYTRNETVNHPPTFIRELDTKVDKPVTVIPPPVKTSPPPASSSMKVTTPVITDDDLVRAEDEVPKLDSIGNKSIGVANVTGDDVNGIESPFEGMKGGHSGVVEPPKAMGTGSTFFTAVEVPPAFPGGEAALSRFLSKNIRYPHLAQETGLEGKVFVQFVVNAAGKISDVQAIGVQRGGGLEEEAMRVVRMMPDWKPGKQNGAAVNVRFVLPIGFRLDN